MLFSLCISYLINYLIKYLIKLSYKYRYHTQITKKLYGLATKYRGISNLVSSKPEKGSVAVFRSSPYEVTPFGGTWISHVSRGTLVKIHATPREILCFPRQGLGGTYLITKGVAWRPVSHTRDVQWGGGYKVWPYWLCLTIVGELKNWMLEQPVIIKVFQASSFS